MYAFLKSSHTYVVTPSLAGKILTIELEMYSTGRRELWCMGSRGLEGFSQVATSLAIGGNIKSKVLVDLYGRPSHTASAHVILTRSYTLTLCSRWMSFVCNCLYCVQLCVHMFN